MSSPFPPRLDPLRAVATNADFCGTLSLGSLSRLADLIEPDPTGADGQVAYQVRFGRDAEGRAVVQGSVQASLRLRCQRCNEPLDLPVAAGFALVLVAGFDEAAALPPEYEPLLVPEAHSGGLMNPRDLVEDELILAVPVVPRHAEGGCPVTLPAVASDAGAAGGRPGHPGEGANDPSGPFAILAGFRAVPASRHRGCAPVPVPSDLTNSYTDPPAGPARSMPDIDP